MFLIGKRIYKNLTKRGHYLKGRLKVICKTVPLGLTIVNFFFQRILRINGKYRFPVHFTSRVIGEVKIGTNVWISFAVSGGCYIQGGNGVEIGDGTIFAPGVKIISANHSLDHSRKWMDALPVKIGKNVWIGANAVILPRVQIGDSAIIGAGAVVTKSVRVGEIVVGNPARPINKMSL